MEKNSVNQVHPKAQRLILESSEAELWLNFILAVRGYSFVGLYKYQIFERYRKDRNRLVAIALGLDPSVKRYRNKNFKETAPME